MFCNKCGHKLKDFAMYCERCGTKIQKEELTEIFSESDSLNRYYKLEYELGDINEQLNILPSKQAYLKRLKQSRDLKLSQLQQVRETMKEEKKDYEALLKLSFASIKARLSGKLNEKKRKEEAEYLEALANFKYAEKEFQNLDNEIKTVQNDVRSIQGLKSRIPAIENRMERILAQLTAGKATDRIKELQYQYEDVQKELTRAQEIQNRFRRADSLLLQAENLLNNSVGKLRSAEGLGTWDTFFGGGFFVDSFKHGDLDSARNSINQAQTLLRQAKDLVDVVDDIYIGFEAPNLFFDIFFDNFFFDLFGNATISRTREQVERALGQLRSSRNTLSRSLAQWERERNELAARVNQVRKQIREERLSLL
ncbi:MAG: zinc-ribbon domain-containing protein [Candidatus Hodarchaeota archaeon]